VGRLRLIARLVLRDLRCRPAQAVLMLIVIAAATTTLSLGLALTGATSHPYAQTRAATRGPDVVASFQRQGQPRGVTDATGLAAMHALAHQPGVARSSGPYPVA